jgi:hypothetical protein
VENSYDFGYCFFFVDRISTDIKDVPGLSGHGGADFYCIGSFIEAIAVCINYINILLDWNVCFERDNCCFSAKHTVLKINSKDGLGQNHNNVYRLLFQ